MDVLSKPLMTPLLTPLLTPPLTTTADTTVNHHCRHHPSLIPYALYTAYPSLIELVRNVVRKWSEIDEKTMKKRVKSMKIRQKIDEKRVKSMKIRQNPDPDGGHRVPAWSAPPHYPGTHHHTHYPGHPPHQYPGCQSTTTPCSPGFFWFQHGY